jgi:carbonic anhydrase
MLTRRLLCGCLAAASGFAARTPAQGAECAVFDSARQRAVTPDDALDRLKTGNERFVAGKTINCDLMDQVKQTGEGQFPFATVLGCIDSRVPPELVLDQRIGDLFTVRIAGNFINDDIVGSLEFATKIAGSRLIVVLGHSECGAIKGAIDKVELGLLTAMLANFQPAIDASKGVAGEQTSKNGALVQRVAEENVKFSVTSLTRRSAVLRDLVQTKQLAIVGVMHDIRTGSVVFAS